MFCRSLQSSGETNSQLLESLQDNSNSSSASVGIAFEDRALKAVRPAGKVRRLWNHCLLVLVVGYDFGQFLLDICRINRLTSDTRECLSCFDHLALLDEESGRVGKEDESGAKNQSPQELDSDWDSV